MRDILPLNTVVSRTSNMALSLTIKESRSRGCQTVNWCFDRTTSLKLSLCCGQRFTSVKDLS